MITKEIARLVFHSHAEIENAEKMITEIKSKLTDDGNLELKDRWGDVRGDLQLHIPSNSGSYHVKGVRGVVAIKVLQDHIEDHKKELERLKGVCIIQLA